MNRKKLPLVAFFGFLALLQSQTIPAEEIQKVALLPFKVYTRTDAEVLTKKIYGSFVSRLKVVKNLQLVDPEALLSFLAGKTIDDSLALTLGRDVGASYVITGSATELGGVINIDVRLLDVKREQFLPLISAQGKGLDSIDNMVSQLTGDMTIRIGGEQRIARIEFQGNHRIESSAISQVLKSSTGSLFLEAKLAQDIKAIYKLGYFTDVRADVKGSPEGRIITFVLQEKGIITAVKIQGNKAVSTDDIQAVITVKPRQILNQEKIKDDVARIKDLYDAKGYYNAEIKDTLEKAGDKDISVVFDVQENERLYIRNIAFKGNEAYRDKELREIMKTNVKGFFSFFTDSGILKKEQLRQDVEKINAFYLNHGFIYAQVGEPEVTHDREGINIKIPITEGKQYRVGKIAITGDELQVSRNVLMEKLEINKKHYYDRESVIKDMDYLQKVCSDEGYAYAEITPKTIPQEKNLTVDVTYNINKGNKVYFHRINITGNTKTRDKVIRRLLTVVEGDLYSRTKLKQSYMAINRLRYFEEVDFQTERGPRENLTNVNIRVREKPTGMFSVGAGYSAIENAIFTAQVTQQNLFGRGQSLSLRAGISSVSTKVELSFVEPWLFDMPLYSKFDIWKTDREYDTYTLDTKGGGFMFGYPLWESISGYLGYKLSSDDVRDVSPTASSFIRRQEGVTTTSGVTATITRDTTNDAVFPSKGSKNSLMTEYTGGILQGDSSFIKYQLSSAWFFPLPFDTVFGLRGRAGYLQERGGKDAPVYERFYLGGINSLRGLRSVGPVDPFTGDVIGGLTMLNFNVEYLYPLIKDAGMKGVVFYDTGNSWEKGYHPNDMRQTAGIGIRWYSPIGPLRLEWGYVLDQKEGEARSRWEFTIGMFM